VGPCAAAKVVSLDDPLEPASFRSPDHRHNISLHKDLVHFDFLSRLHFLAAVGRTKLAFKGQLIFAGGFTFITIPLMAMYGLTGASSEPSDTAMMPAFQDFATKDMPEDYAMRLVRSKVITINHVLPALQQKLKWPEQERTIAIMKALGHSDLQMTMHYVSLGKSHIREQVEKLNTIQLLPPAARGMKALPAPPCASRG
jgi:hypothetical protein